MRSSKNNFAPFLVWLFSGFVFHGALAFGPTTTTSPTFAKVASVTKRIRQDDNGLISFRFVSLKLLSANSNNNMPGGAPGNDGGGIMSTTEAANGLSYGERSRKYRRDVFNYDLWVKHRSTDRFLGNLVEMVKSGVIRTLSGELLLLTFVAVFVCLYNGLGVVGYDDFQGIQHDALLPNGGWPLLKFPPAFFTLTSPALALLLGMFI